MSKRLEFVQRSQGQHWVGDGFPVRSIFTYNDIHEAMSPFLLLDYAGPAEFAPTEARRGVGQHPHRGFETVTIVYDGEVEHRDSAGGGGSIGPGDVQWMTAAAGIVHEEFHGREFARRGGRFEMIQLWVNLPVKDKMGPPGYQSIRDAQIPRVALPRDAGMVRVIAGSYAGHAGPARTFSPMNVWDVRVREGERIALELPEGHTAALFVLKGGIRIAGGGVAEEAQLAVLERAGTVAEFEALRDSTLLLLGGAPTNEPIVGYGPFVMTSEEEINQAFLDYRSGKMGRLAATTG